MASSILLKFPRNTEVQTKDINIDNALSRVRRPLDSTKVTLGINGIYALPESWKQKIQTVSHNHRPLHHIKITTNPLFRLSLAGRPKREHVQL